tara:strand:+ start:118 stop:810 length:693 start_codon:yes stop_codon:yes gene_type:complete
MATTSATLTLASADMLTDNLSFTATSVLTTAGTATGLSNTTGLARKTTTSANKYTLFYADDYTADKAHKLYFRNTETTAGLFFTITMGSTDVGRIYANDWALIPWSASDGTKEVFTITFSGVWAAADTLTFDGVTINADTDHTTTATLVRATQYPNWTVSGSGSDAIFTSKRARADQEINATEWTVVDAGGSDAAISVATTTEGLDNAANVYITPSTSASHTIEYMLLYE